MTDDIAEFLTSRRTRITPERAGLPTDSSVSDTTLNPADAGWAIPDLEPAARRR